MNADEDDACVYIPAVIQKTPYDRRLQEVRELEQLRNKLLQDANRRSALTVVETKLEKAEKRLKEEVRRGADDRWRRRRDIDDWRSRDGKELHNAKRRKVRSQPNKDLSGLTEDQKEERKRNQRAEWNFVDRLRKKGLPENEIQDALSRRRGRNSSV